MTPAEKMLAQELVEQIQALTHKNITVSTLLCRAVPCSVSRTRKVLKAIKENIKQYK
jgi:hypothetical protein